MDALQDALSRFFQPHVLGIVVLASAYGLFVGAIPGLTATMAVALLVPLTFYLGDVEALAAIVALEACAIFAGDIPTALIRIPGTPSSAAYADDAFAITRSGRPELCLGTSLVFSVAGGLIGVLVLIVAAPQLASVAAERFSTLEYFWLTLLGLSCAVVVSRDSLLKGVIALLIGLLLATVGLSAVHSQPRFTFGRDELISGVSFIPAMIGLFGISEVLRNVIQPPAALAASIGPRAGGERSAGFEPLRWLLRGVRSLFGPPLSLLWRRKLHALRSSLIGSFVGMLPGAGADIGAWISYAASKRFSRRPSEYGRGSVEGVADATGANNAALAGAWIPSLVFGIPGDSVTAIVIGVLLMKNITPGPAIFEKQASLVYGIYLMFIAANLVLIPLGFLAIRAGSLIVRVPRRILLPLILLFSIVGSYAISGNYFDVWVMLGMGVIGFLLEAFGVPLGPVVLGIILGDRLEETFIQNWTKAESWLDFFGRPWAAALGCITIAVWISPLVLGLGRRLTSARGGHRP
ncbi:MAG: tripartite tricarboxylate transporter permease [Planctomycetes bacterium]|nr:tripartite tricarboxylate transporter permease [Planctomycetota bacterium]